MNAKESRELEMAGLWAAWTESQIKPPEGQDAVPQANHHRSDQMYFAFYGDKGTTVAQLFWTKDEYSRASTPPLAAERILLFFLGHRDVEPICGDLEEIYRTSIVPKLGPRLAALWYWKEVIWTIGALLWRKVPKVAILVGIWEVFRRRLGL